MLGNSLGAMGELSYGFYLYKLFAKKKPDLQVMQQAIHPDVKAGTKHPFAVFIYRPFMLEPLNKEIEAYIKHIGGHITYIDTPEQLSSVL
jgi:hypothetical protein